MAKQLKDFMKSVSQMSTNELLDLTKKIRKNKYSAKPATVARKSKAGKSTIEKLKGSLSKEDLIALLKGE